MLRQLFSIFFSSECVVATFSPVHRFKFAYFIELVNRWLRNLIMNSGKKSWSTKNSFGNQQKKVEMKEKSDGIRHGFWHEAVATETKHIVCRSSILSTSYNGKIYKMVHNDNDFAASKTKRKNKQKSKTRILWMSVSDGIIEILFKIYKCFTEVFSTSSYSFCSSSDCFFLRFYITILCESKICIWTFYLFMFSSALLCSFICIGRLLHFNLANCLLLILSAVFSFRFICFCLKFHATIFWIF